MGRIIRGINARLLFVPDNRGARFAVFDSNGFYQFFFLISNRLIAVVFQFHPNLDVVSGIIRYVIYCY